MNAALYLEIARFLLQGVFQFMKLAGASVADQEKMFNEEYEKFKQNDPATLPPV